MAGNEWSSKGMTYFHGEYEGDPYGLLAVEIVMHAIFDWRKLIKRKAWESESTSRYCNFDELRAFFNGQWCELLLIKTHWEGERILEILEAELQAAMLQPKKKGRKRKK